MKKILDKASAASIFIYLSIFIGILLRFRQYLFNRALWLDEANVALNIVDKSFSQLVFGHLDRGQAAPPGFLFVEKFFIVLFGNNEYSLRFFSLLASIVSIFLFYRLAKRLLNKNATLIAVTLFSISNLLILHAPEVKQYSLDVFVALSLYLFTFYAYPNKMTFRWFMLLGAFGGVAMLFSYPAIFVLGGIGVGLMLFYLTRKDWVGISRLFITCFVWLFIFCIYYFYNIRYYTENEWLVNCWRHAYMPFPIMSWQEIQWLIDKFLQIFWYFFEPPICLIAVLLFLVGSNIAWRKEKTTFFILVIPIFLALIASAFRKYPFVDRPLLFIAPPVLLFIGMGGTQILEKNKPGLFLVGIVFTSILLVYPSYYAALDFVKPHYKEEIRPVINYVKTHKLKNDRLYVAPFGQPNFIYYSNKYGFSKRDYIQGTNPGEDFKAHINDFNKLRGNKRVWVLFSDGVKTYCGVNMENFYISYIDTIGKKLDMFKAEGAAVYLYDLSYKEKDISEKPTK